MLPLPVRFFSPSSAWPRQASLSIHHLPEFTQTHVQRVGDAIQPSHPLSSPFPPAPNPSQHQSFPMRINLLFVLNFNSDGSVLFSNLSTCDFLFPAPPPTHPLPPCTLSVIASDSGGTYSVQFSSVTQSCLTLCDPMNRSTPGLPVHHHLPEFTQTHVHRVGDAIQPSHPLSSPSPPAPHPSQHQSLFQWVNSSHEVAKVLEFQL